MADHTVPALGVSFVPTMPPETLPALARAAESSGLDELWVWEDSFKQSGVASAAVALAHTERLHVGIGLMPVPLRNAALTAMEVATLARIHPGRLTYALGHGVQEWMQQAGVKPASPLTLLREYTSAVQALLAGGPVSVEGRYVRLREVVLDWPPTPVPRLMVGGSGPRSLALASELGDGVLLTNALSEAEIADIRRTVDEHTPDGAPPRSLGATLIAATGPDAAERVAREVPLWGGDAGATGDRRIGAAGDAAELAAAVDRMARCGATAVSIQPTADEPDLDGFITFLGREVRPRLGG